ncbi:MAG TPA: zinc metalloprotease, partial [Kofleriaceae bacterium]|nr:zinc metalloprotease [Kofleriaceae bacterium]
MMRRVDTTTHRPLMAALVLALAAACSTTVDTGEEDGTRIADPLADDYDECAERDWYGDGQCDTGCLDPDPDCISATCDDACADYCDISWSGGTPPALPDGCTAEMCDCGEPPVECPDLCASQCFGEPLPDEIPPDCPSFTCDCAEAAWEPDESGIVPVAGAQERCLQESTDASTRAELDSKDSAGAFLAMASSVRSRRTIPIVFHVIRRRGGAGDVGRSRLVKQLKVMNRAYSRTPFKFKLSKITRTTNNSWFSMGIDSSAEANAKKALHRGGMATMNVYTTGTSSALGWATFPWRREGKQDGIVMDYTTLPGGSNRPYNLGDTLVHEGGHWVGLFHTFENGCSSPGDAVGDTAYEAEPGYGCPTSRDSCRRSRGKDPVRNYM